MLGAVYGDIIGSYYEVHSTKDYNFPLQKESTFTDDTVLTVAVCQAILNNPKNISVFDIRKRGYEYAVQYQAYYKRYPYSGYGAMFTAWAKSDELSVQKSYGNGGVMRVVPIGYAYDTLEQVLLQAKASCYYTHNHRETIAGAKTVAGSVWLALHGKDKKEIQTFCEKQFDMKLDVPIDSLREYISFDSRTNKSVPPSVIAFLQSNDYESAVRNAISLGGDADTMACIAGGIAEAYYKAIPHHIQSFCDSRIDFGLKTVIQRFRKTYADR